jgi:hypothetical protein
MISRRGNFVLVVVAKILDAVTMNCGRTFAAGLGITLHFISLGWTGEPPDRHVFGALKPMCRRLFQRFCDGIQGERVRTVNAVQLLREAWDQLETKGTQEGWGIYKDRLGPPEESDNESEYKEELND